MNTRVLIVGAGPTGLMAANQLMRFGIDFFLVDKKAGPTRESRAIVVTARSLEIYQQMGLDRQAVEGGKIVKSFNLYTNGKRKAEVKIGEIGKGLSEFSYMLTFEQSQNEELLAHNLTSNGKVVHWNHEFVRLIEHTNGIRAIVQNGLEELTINAEYLIACDGANSQVRQQLNFSFRGGTYKYKFFVVDTRLQWALGFDKFIITPGNENFCAFLPLKKDQTYRIIGTLPKEYGNREDITFRDIENVVMHTIGVNITFETVNWFSVYKLHHRGVEQFSTGRVFLAGDSAHIHSPAGGQGMNTGLQDAYNLCWKLAFVLRGQALPSLLDTYNEERLPFAKFLLKFTDRGFNMMTSDHWLIRSFRKYVALKLADKVLIFGFFRQLIFKTISQTGYSYRGKSLSSSVSRQRLRFKAGERLPYFHSESIYFLFKRPCFHILHIHSASLNIGQQEALKKAFPFEVMIVENLPDRWKRLGVSNELFVLVRPDNYIAFIFDTLNVGSIRRYASRYFSSDQP